eukprot:1432243-Pleurochrysis_carterae.AAC.3
MRTPACLRRRPGHSISKSLATNGCEVKSKFTTSFKLVETAAERAHNQFSLSQAPCSKGSTCSAGISNQIAKVRTEAARCSQCPKKHVQRAERNTRFSPKCEQRQLVAANAQKSMLKGPNGIQVSFNGTEHPRVQITCASNACSQHRPTQYFIGILSDVKTRRVLSCVATLMRQCICNACSQSCKNCPGSVFLRRQH